MLDAFYGAFSPACFALLGLWLVVVQIRMGEWQASAVHRRRSYGVALHFALPGVMSLLALIDPADPAFWRVSFVIVALGGAVVLSAVRGLPARRERAASGRPPFMNLTGSALAHTWWRSRYTPPLACWPWPEGGSCRARRRYC